MEKSAKTFIGDEVYSLAVELFPICRSITGNGVRRTLEIIGREILDLQVHEVPTGTMCFDWSVPKEWNIRDAYIIDPEGNKIADFMESNLHVLGYSVPIDAEVRLEELNDHLYSIPEQPDAIPYRTSYYSQRWGFCISHDTRQRLKPGIYKVYIDSTLDNGALTYGDLLLPGETDREVLLSTNICHPSLANNELSGPTVTTFLCKWLQSLPKRRYSYRVLFIPETIGSIFYLSRHLDHLKTNVDAGFNLTCIGDDRAYSFLPSKRGDSLADRVALHVLRHVHPQFKLYTFLDRSSDERQYCSQHVDLPVVSVMRSKYREYPEYHTSKDDLSLISPEGLSGGYEVMRRCISCLERNLTYAAAFPCEPQLGKRGLYPTVSSGINPRSVKTMMNFISYCDGTRDFLDIADLLDVPMWELYDVVDTLIQEKILTPVARKMAKK